MTSILKLVIVPAPSSNDHAVQCLADGKDAIGQLGLDPDDFFRPQPTITPRETPHEALVGRCDCGVVGCGDTHVRITRQGDQIVWLLEGRELRFAAEQYEAELARAAQDFSWEPPDRTAARLVRERLPHQTLLLAGFVFNWGSGRARPGKFTVSLYPAVGAYRQILVEVPWVDDIERVVEAALAAVAKHARYVLR